jgi:hypothetical protein
MAFSNPPLPPFFKGGNGGISEDALRLILFFLDSGGEMAYQKFICV